MYKLLIPILLLLYSGGASAQWSEQNSPIPFTIFSLSAVNDNIVWASASGANILRTTNGGVVWENVGANVPPPFGVEPCIFAIDANTALYSSYSGAPIRTAYVYKTTNAGGNWTLVLTQGTNAYISGIWIKPGGEGFMVGWPVSGRWSLWKTTNYGSNWDSTGLYIPESNPSVWSFENSVFYLDNHIWFGARSKGIYYSSNNGASWQLQDLSSTGFPYPSAMWFENATTGLSSADRNIIRTTNSGSNWAVLQGTSGPEVIRGITGGGNEWWYVRFLSNQIFYTSNSGQNWSAQYTAPSSAGYNHITKGRNSGIKLWAARIDGGISTFNPSIGIKKISGEVPEEFLLFQNYPNPFNPSTRIKFALPPSPHRDLKAGGPGVRLLVFDILGREVATLIDESLSPGTYEVDFDGSYLPSGVYYYTLSANTFTETRKMILLK